MKNETVQDFLNLRHSIKTELISKPLKYLVSSFNSYLILKNTNSKGKIPSTSHFTFMIFALPPHHLYSPLCSKIFIMQMDLNSFIKYLPSSFSDSEGWMIYNSGTEELYKWSESASEVTQFCPTLCDPMDSSLHQAPPSMGFSRQEIGRAHV